MGKKKKLNPRFATLLHKVRRAFDFHEEKKKMKNDAKNERNI